MHRRKVLSSSDELVAALRRTHVDEYAETEVARLSSASYRRLSSRPEWLERIARCADEARMGDVAAELIAAGVRPVLAIRAEQELRATDSSREREWEAFFEELARVRAHA